ncbi:hypothetical protein T492DRAFT_98700 [Pavlovales sp. CCMP2436]|nr:hypothetical protein T492DRAFT_98700 [Pavlovales sp. CCMP2436]
MTAIPATTTTITIRNLCFDAAAHMQLLQLFLDLFFYAAAVILLGIFVFALYNDDDSDILHSYTILSSALSRIPMMTIVVIIISMMAILVMTIILLMTTRRGHAAARAKAQGAEQLQILLHQNERSRAHSGGRALRLRPGGHRRGRAVKDGSSWGARCCARGQERQAGCGHGQGRVREQAPQSHPKTARPGIVARLPPQTRVASTVGCLQNQFTAQHSTPHSCKKVMHLRLY